MDEPGCASAATTSTCMRCGSCAKCTSGGHTPCVRSRRTIAAVAVLVAAIAGGVVASVLIGGREPTPSVAATSTATATPAQVPTAIGAGDITPHLDALATAAREGGTRAAGTPGDEATRALRRRCAPRRRVARDRPARAVPLLRRAPRAAGHAPRRPQAVGGPRGADARLLGGRARGGDGPRDPRRPGRRLPGGRRRRPARRRGRPRAARHLPDERQGAQRAGGRRVGRAHRQRRPPREPERDRRDARGPGAPHPRGVPLHRGRA